MRAAKPRRAEQLLTTAEVAEHLRIPEGKVRQMIRRRELRAINVASGERVIYRISPTDLTHFEQARATRSA